jgi:hypothetical protein
MNMKKTVCLSVLVLLAVAFAYGQGFDFDDFGGMGGLPVGAGSNKAMDRANDAQDKMEGRIPMRFFDAVSREPIPNAAIEIPNVGNFTTNNQGKIAFPKIADGSYTLIFKKSGYIETPIDFRVFGGAVDFNWYNVSKEIPLPPRPPVPAPTPAAPAVPVPATNYRIVLEWGEKPADLDLHFVKTGGSGNYHISYSNMKQADDRNAVLDRDDRQGYGPETITIGRMDNNASYTCYVHDYTNRTNAESVQMPQAGATIRVYSDNRLAHTFKIPSGVKGNRWNVFKIERGVLTGVNTVTVEQR